MLPLIDVVFLLLVVFLYAAVTMVRAHVVAVELPELLTGEAGRLPAVLVVGVDREGEVSVAGEPVDRAELIRRLNERSAAEEDLEVLVHADARALHGDVVGVLDAVRAGGLRRVLIVGRDEG
jgi:biopolymer transport protein ExbD